MIRYSTIKTGDPREIVLLKGRGCQYKQCAFCDYYDDGSDDDAECARINTRVLDDVTGVFGVLEVICSGSFCELHEGDIAAVQKICEKCGIRRIIVESHWMYRAEFDAFRARMAPVEVEFKAGIETFDITLRNLWRKGIGDVSPAELAEYFQQCNLIVGVAGQSFEGVAEDIRTALRHFRRVCVNVFCENTTEVNADTALIRRLRAELFSQYADDSRVDILTENTDFGVGAEGGHD